MINDFKFYLSIVGLWFAHKNPTYELFFKRKKVLDVGCGEGSLLRLDPENFYGIDINDTLLAKLVAEGLNVKKGSVTSIPFEDGAFDAVQCSNIIEHLSPADAHKMLQEMVRVLKNDGCIVLTTPMPKTIWNTFGHVKPYPPSAIKKILRPVSLESFDSISDLRIKYVLYYGMWAIHPLTFFISTIFANMIPELFAGSYVMVIEKYGK